MISRRYLLILLLALSTAYNVHSFSIPASLIGTTRVKRVSALQAGFATECYLSSLTQLSRSSSVSSTEDYLNSLARLGDVSRTSFSGEDADYFGCFNIAHAKRSSLTLELSEAPHPLFVKTTSEPDNADSSLMKQTRQSKWNIKKAREINSQVSVSVDSVTKIKISEVSSAEIAKLSDSLAKVGSTGAAKMSKLLGGVADPRLISKGSTTLQGTGATLDLGGNKLIEKGSAVAAATGQIQFSDVENSVLSGLSSVGNAFMDILDYVTVIRIGSAFTDLLATAQASVNGVVNGAIQSVVQTMHGNREVNLEIIVKSLASLVATVAKVLFQILSAVIKAVSGKSMSEWSVDVKGNLVQETSKVMAQASVTESNLNEKSLSELADAIGSFSNHVVTLAAESVTAISGLMESSGDPVSSTIMSNSAETASHLSSYITM
uniref:Uncharacterized protein n=1 Tax=Ditylum brightwellii TaxID=49249 RepID=A0A7S4T9V1_9STRA